MKKKIVAGALAIVVTAALVVGVVVVGPGKKTEQIVPEATDQVVVEIETEEENETEPAPTVIVKDKQDKVDIEVEQVASSADPDTGLHGNGDGAFFYSNTGWLVYIVEGNPDNTVRYKDNFIRFMYW